MRRISLAKITERGIKLKRNLIELYSSITVQNLTCVLKAQGKDWAEIYSQWQK